MVKKNTFIYGVMSEKLAVSYLKNKNYKLLYERYKTSYGEIDIVAVSESKVLVFIEVKARNGSEHLITRYQMQRIRNAALNFITQHDKYQNYDLRFDAILIHGDKIVNHIENAWESEYVD